MSVKVRLESEFKDKGLKKARSDVTQFAGYAGGLFKRLALSFAGIFAISKIKDFVVSSIAAFGQQEKSVKKLEAALHSSGESVDAYMGRLKNVAAALRVVARVNEDVAFDAMTLASSYGVAADNLDEVASAAVAFNKAFNLPIREGVRAIADAFAGNTNALSNNIKALKGIKSASEAYTIIVATANKLLREQSAISGTNSEKLEAIKIAWNELKAVFGGFLLTSGGVSNVLDEVMLALEDIQNVGFQEWLNDLFPRITRVADALGKMNHFLYMARISFPTPSTARQVFGNMLNGDRSVDGVSYSSDAASATRPDTRQLRLNEIRLRREQRMAAMREQLINSLGVGGLSPLNAPSQEKAAQSRSLSIGDLFEMASGQFGNQDPVVSELKKQTDILSDIRDEGVGGLAED